MKNIISASRRTDLIRSFPEQLSKWLEQEYVIVKNPYNKKERRVDLSPERVHTLVLWSKDFQRLLENEHGLKDQVKRYSQIVFHYTVTGLGGTRIEPGIINSKEAVKQFEPLIALAKNADNIYWRFDPVVFWREKGKAASNVHLFRTIAKYAAKAGISKSIFSIAHWYRKSMARAKHLNFEWINPSAEKYKEVSEILKQEAKKANIDITACCTSEVIPHGIIQSKCIDGNSLIKSSENSGEISLKKDKGQRKECACTESIDIGSYDLRCPEACIYCYANPYYNEYGVI